MRLVSLLAILCALAACSTSPPPPPKCEGDFRPVNIQQKGVSALSHDVSLALCAGAIAHDKA
jgi:hypothetical protein